MAQYKQKGDELIAKGNKKAKGSFFGNLMKSKEERAETAIELYKNAATQYKLAQEWQLAAQAFLKCAQCDQAINGGEAADYYVEAAGMLKKVKDIEYIEYLNKAIDIYCSENRINMGARLKKQIAEAYEQDLQYDLACSAYQEAADLYYAENDHASDYFNMRLKVADLSIHKIDCNFVECIKIYDEVAEKWLQNSLTAPSAKKLFFSSILLYLANDDSVGAGMALEKYTDKLPSFNNTRQQKFLTAIIKCIEENNTDEFSAQCYELNKIIPLDKWQTSILTKIKEKISPQGGNNEDNLEGEQQFQQDNDVPTGGIDVF